MPELPEAETIARDLRRRVVGSTITGTSVPKPDILAPPLTPRRTSARLRGRRITATARRAKKVILELDDANRIVIHLGMTGRVMTSDATGAGDLRHIVTRLRLRDGRDILFDDARRFGLIEIVDADAWPEWSAALGPEPLSGDFSTETLFRGLRASSTPVRNWLLDQKRVAGIGNIYACEALFRAGIRPTRRARTITRRQATALHTALRSVLREAIRARGTTFRDYRDARGGRGAFQARLAVYDRETEPCFTCDTPIRRTILSNRSAFYCPACQR
ncbi:MAG: bifunctional DNA-formamidopyrimidine glycosylase/DNA-(apurinic or apyrimidinic site) lyase [Gemmatimonadota bacterium]|jgi:formamidopyrimidine-DNA glycosylase